MNNISLLDASVFIALATPDHSLHARAGSWFIRVRPRFAACPITQGALIRFYLRFSGAGGIAGAKRLLASINALPEHTFRPDDVSYLGLPELGVTGHRQVTDTDLVSLARGRDALLATMDEALAALHPRTADLIT